VEENKTVKNLVAPKGLTKTFNIGSVESPKKLFAEKIIRKTVTHELIEKTFTTESKHKPKTTIKINRKGNIVKEKCRQLTEIVLNLFPDRIISHKDLAFLVMDKIGGDRGTIRAYMGYNGYVKHSNSGNLSIVIGKKRKGYLETFGFMTRKGMKWIIHAQSQLLPPHTPLSLNNECVSKNYSKENFSLSQSPTLQINTERLSDCRGQGDSECETDSSSKINNNNNTERERNFTPKIIGKIESITDKNLEFLERLAKATPVEDEDLARKKCPKIKWGRQ